MSYKKGEDRRQYTMVPDCIDDYVGADSPCRVFDVFINMLDMKKPGFDRSTPAVEGRPGYDPRDLLKLYVYGYYYGMRSSRKLERECKCNIEVMWLLNRLTPNFRTISDFRKDNKSALKSTFKAFNRKCLDLSLFSRSFISIDGSKFKACNSKDRNFTLSKLDDRISRLDIHMEEYLKEPDDCDAAETDGLCLSREELERRIAICRERREQYERYRTCMEENGLSQLSLTDPEAKLMKTGEGFGVCYNIQTGVDAGSHLISGFEVTDHPTDHGLVTPVHLPLKKITVRISRSRYPTRDTMTGMTCVKRCAAGLSPTYFHQGETGRWWWN
jgi:transposase